MFLNELNSISFDVSHGKTIAVNNGGKMMIFRQSEITVTRQFFTEFVSL